MAELVQVATSTTGSVSLTGTTAGNPLVLISRQESNSRQLTGAGDGVNAWLVAQAGNNPDLAYGMGSAYVISGAGGNITVTPTYDVAPTSQTLILLEYKGPVLALDINDLSDFGGLAGTSETLGPHTTIQDAELQVGYAYGQILNRSVDPPTSPAFVVDEAFLDRGSSARNLVVVSLLQATSPGAQSMTWQSDGGTTNQNWIIGWLSFTKPQVPTMPGVKRKSYPAALMDAAS